MIWDEKNRSSKVGWRKVGKYDDVEGGRVYKEEKVEKYDDIDGGRGV